MPLPVQDYFGAVGNALTDIGLVDDQGNPLNAWELFQEGIEVFGGSGSQPTPAPQPPPAPLPPAGPASAAPVRPRLPFRPQPAGVDTGTVIALVGGGLVLLTLVGGGIGLAVYASRS